MASIHLKRVLGLIVICFLSWPVHMKSIPSNEHDDLPSRTGAIDLRPKLPPNSLRQMAQITNWFGGLLGAGSAKPFIRCSCSCGDANVEPRIVGGRETQSNEYPWMARLQYFDRFYCGASLINDRYVLTAAHCSKTLSFMIKVTFGEHNHCKSKPLVTRFVSRIISRQTLFSLVNDNDIALFKLDDRVPINRSIRPICLPQNKDADYSGAEAIVAGWGATVERGRSSCGLRQVNVPILSDLDCRKHTNYRNISFIMTKNMMCAGYEKGGADSCQGDSGGPLVIQRKNTKQHEIVGVVSWGVGCARPDYPGVYTRVTRYIDWIQENSRDGCFCRD